MIPARLTPRIAPRPVEPEETPSSIKLADPRPLFTKGELARLSLVGAAELYAIRVMMEFGMGAVVSTLTNGMIYGPAVAAAGWYLYWKAGRD